MALITWRDEFKLGITEIDEQHQKMLSIINKLSDLFAEKKHENEKEIDRVIKEMADYAIYHFDTEERYFKLFGYEKSVEHIAIHDQYRSKIEEWRNRYNESKDPAIFFEVSSYLETWWNWHINNTDREYVPYLQANGVK